MAKKVDETPVVTTGPQVIKRTVWVPVPEYPGFELEVWANHPQRLSLDLLSPDVTVVQAALTKVIVAHNGWRDYEGVEYPAANTDEFWEAIPTELAIVAMQLVNTAVTQLPNSLRATKRR